MTRSTNKNELSEFELRRQEKIRRNQEMLASLQIPKLEKRKSVSTTPSKPRKTPVQRSKESTSSPLEPVRTSKRLKKEPPELASMLDDPETAKSLLDPKLVESLAFVRGDPTNKENEVLDGDWDARAQLLERESAIRLEFAPPPRTRRNESLEGVLSKLDIQSPEHDIVRLCPSRIYSLAMHDGLKEGDAPIIFAGDKKGNFCIWDVAAYKRSLDENEESSASNGISQFKFHNDSVSSICSVGNSVYSSGYDGIIRCLDLNSLVSKQMIKLPHTLISHLQPNSDASVIYFSTNSGSLGRLDTREKPGTEEIFYLHDKKISSFSFNDTQGDPFLLVTSSNDRTVAFWDQRKLIKGESFDENDGNVPLSKLEHKNAVTCAFLCPSDPRKLVTNCYDDRIRLYDNVSLENCTPDSNGNPSSLKSVATIYHNNKTGQWITPFKAKWFPLVEKSESVFMMGNMDKTLELYSGSDGSLIAALDHDLLTAQPAVNTIHPMGHPLIASGTGSGKVFLWSTTGQ